MPIDSFTVLLFGFCLKALLGALFLMYWFREERAPWFAWWSATFALGSVTTAFYMARGFAPELFAVGFASASVILAFACAWQGARAFDRRRPQWIPLLAAPALWLAACLIPGFMANVTLRVIASSLLVTPLLALTALEFWRGRAESLPSRMPVVALFAVFALLFASRIAFVDVLPFPFGGLAMESAWLAAFNLVAFFHTVLLAVLVVALTKERLEFEQRTKAQTDPLTGALNRRAFILRGTRLLLRHQIESTPMCLLFLDLDHFKSLNDRFGHSGGDDVLVRFVNIVHDCIRPTDFLFRIGGEEFCCLLPNTATAQADRVAERIRHQVEIATVDIASVPVHTTVSIGIASTEIFGCDIETLMRRADMAVYAAKRQGRNRVVVATADDAVENIADAARGDGKLPSLIERARSWKSA